MHALECLNGAAAYLERDGVPLGNGALKVQQQALQDANTASTHRACVRHGIYRTDLTATIF